MHSFYCLADIGNGPELLKLYVEEMNNPNSENTTKRAYQLQNIEKQQIAVNGSHQQSVSHSSQSVATKNISDLVSLVKQHDNNFAPHKSSVVVNEDGTPKVVFHGSYRNFSVFDGNAQKQSKAPAGAHFFTDREDVAYSFTGYKEQAVPGGSDYKGGIYPVYLKMDKPYVVDFEGKLWSEKVNGMDINDVARYAKANGYDGVIATNIIDEGGQGDVNWNEEIPRMTPATDYIVFNSTQIKSATDNTGIP